MLKQRTMTGAIIAAVFLVVLVLTPAPVFALCVGMVMGVAAWEWANLSNLSRGVSRWAFVVVLLGLGPFLWWLTSHEGLGFTPEMVLIATAMWWALALLWVQGYPASAVLWRPRWVRLVMGCWVLLPAWLALTWLRDMPHGRELVIFAVAIVAMADIGAYFSGRRFGRRKLAPNVSPGKSWEGVLGGLCSVSLGTLVAAFLLPNQVSWWLLLGIALPTALVSVLGDLLESMLKRHRGIKDSGHILPGHGGVLDRIDGLVAALPVFTLAVLMTDWQL